MYKVIIINLATASTGAGAVAVRPNFLSFLTQPQWEHSWKRHGAPDCAQRYSNVIRDKSHRPDHYYSLLAFHFFTKPLRIGGCLSANTRETKVDDNFDVSHAMMMAHMTQTRSS
ncbi:hypothetical protein EVAR_79726_1 [Eumeta japonica]|uniref:Uncharacterized protein n=1 Tax=Eumeta variegata TaxID=151549 RepID=A0A4C1T938_EUMVA|nr:hypothetical protein EVAR_79726_1 [Eumeta japonica]